ncbi:MAG: glycosyltransferase family 9 protein, partial [Algisphaera sp.]
YDTAVLLPNSFRSAALAAMSGIKRRVGYDRDGRGVLLTDRLVSRHDGKAYVPVPAIDYYLSLAHYLGAVACEGDHKMQVATRPEDDVRAASLLESAKGRPVVLLNPGAAKIEKRWAPQSFAQLAGRLHDELGFAVAVTGAPDEREVVARVAGAAPCRVIDLLKTGATVSQLKSVMKRCRLVVTNDTGPRHLAAALEVPVVTLFGPTNPAWTEIGFAHEQQLVAADPEAPDAMRQITVSQVFDAAAQLIEKTLPLADSDGATQA